MISKRLLFSKFKEEGFDQYFRLVNNKEVMKMVTGKPVSKTEALIKFNTILSINYSNPDIGYNMISIKQTRLFIGLGKIVMTDQNQAEIGYLLLPEFWNKGYGSEISEKLVEYTSSLNYVKQIVAIIDPENIASRKILLRSNFSLHELCEMDGLPAAVYKLNLVEK